MLIDLTTLAAGRVPVVADIPAAALEVPVEDFTVLGEAHFVGDVERGSGETYHLRGQLTASLETPCARCTEPVLVDVDVPVDLRFMPTTVERPGSRPSPSAIDDDEDGREMAEDDPLVALYDEPRIDLAQVAREQCYLAMPMKPLCRFDCQGLCPQCGINRNTDTCNCDSRWEDPRLAVLKSLLKDADASGPRE